MAKPRAMVLIEKTSGRVEAGSTVATEDALAAPDLISRLHASRQAAVADAPAHTVAADLTDYLPEQKSLALEALHKIYDTAAEKMEVALRTCFHRFDTGAKGDRHRRLRQGFLRRSGRLRRRSLSSRN